MMPLPLLNHVMVWAVEVGTSMASSNFPRRSFLCSTFYSFLALKVFLASTHLGLGRTLFPSTHYTCRRLDSGPRRVFSFDVCWLSELLLAPTFICIPTTNHRHGSWRKRKHHGWCISGVSSRGMDCFLFTNYSQGAHHAIFRSR